MGDVNATPREKDDDGFRAYADTPRPRQTHKYNSAFNREDSQKNVLTPEQEKEFVKTYKIGILKQLHQKGLLTDAQLDQLILMQSPEASRQRYDYSPRHERQVVHESEDDEDEWEL